MVFVVRTCVMLMSGKCAIFSCARNLVPSNWCLKPARTNDESLGEFWMSPGYDGLRHRGAFALMRTKNYCCCFSFLIKLNFGIIHERILLRLWIFSRVPIFHRELETWFEILSQVFIFTPCCLPYRSGRLEKGSWFGLRRVQCIFFVSVFIIDEMLLGFFLFLTVRVVIIIYFVDGIRSSSGNVRDWKREQLLSYLWNANELGSFSRKSGF